MAQKGSMSVPKAPTSASRGPHEAPRRPQEAPTGAPTGLHEAPKRPPRGHKKLPEAPKTL
eukprot:9475320-Pyramimonas_sp.AAC.1